MTATSTVPLLRDGMEVTQQGGGRDSSVLAQILRSADPENAFLDALERGVIPDDVCLELAEHLGEIVEAVNFDNRIEVVFALSGSGAISEQAKQYLLLAILEMDEQEGTEVEVGDELIEITVTIIPLPVPTLEVPAPMPQAPPTNLIFDLVRSVTELQKRFGTNLPEEKWAEIGQVVSSLSDREFSSLRQFPCSAILAQAELEQSRVGLPATLEVVEIISTAREISERGLAVAKSLGRQQVELTSAAFTVYGILADDEGFQLTHRNEHDWPLMTVSSIGLLRNRFQEWLSSHESSLDEPELASAQKAVATLEGFLLAAGPDHIKTAIREKRAVQFRERIIFSWIRVMDEVGEKLAATQPKTKEGALDLLWGHLLAKQSALASELRAADFSILCEAEAVIQRILDLYSACATQRREIAELEAGEYDRLAQRPTLTDGEKRLAFLELERKELDSIRLELERALEEGTEINRNRKKLQILSAITASKLRELDQLIAGLRPAPALEVCHG